MKLFKVERTDNYGYDDYSDFVCLANSKEEARYMAPDPEYYKWNGSHWVYAYRQDKKATHSGWVEDPKTLKVTEIFPEDRTEPEILCASYHAG